MSMRHIAFCVAAATSSVLSIAACSESTDEPNAEQPEDRDASAADSAAPQPEVDARAPADAGPTKPPFDGGDESVMCAGDPCAVELVAGERHFCARMSDGTVRCWGDDMRGSLGVADAGAAGDGGWSAPAVTDLAGVTQIAAGGTTSCALVGDGGVQCWGGNDKGQLGLGAAAPVTDNQRHPAPTPVALEGAVSRVALGPTTACGILASGEVWCWGDNSKLQLGRTTTTGAGAPGRARLGDVAVARIALGTFTGLAVTTLGDVVSWGAVAGAEGSVSARETSLGVDLHPLPIGLGPVTSLSVSSTTLYRPPGVPQRPMQGIGHACAIVAGEVSCWGASRMGALGAGLPEPVRTPLPAPVASDMAWATQVVAAGELSCARLTDGTVECAGDNAFGALGRDPAVAYSLFFEPAAFEGYAVAVAAAAKTVCALEKGGSVLCWGSNERGELGQGRSDDAPHPEPVPVRF